MRYPQHLLKLIEVLKKLPGVGRKSAERYAFEMLTWNPDNLREMAEVISQIPERLTSCKECGCLSQEETCLFCNSERRDRSKLCIIASPRDAFCIDETGEYRGLYHTLDGLLSPMEGLGPEKLNIPKISKRIQQHSVEEVIIAIDSTLEGDATSLYLKQELEKLSVKISRPAFGLPMGSSLDYVDSGTLAQALHARGHF